MIDILKRWTSVVAFHSETASTIAKAVIEARQKGADLLLRGGILGLDFHW